MYVCGLYLYGMNISRILTLTLLLLLVMPTWAQSVRLTPYRAPSALYVDFSHLYNYNRYEHSRIELGLDWVIPNETAEKSRIFLGQWTVSGYAAYGTYDRALKYGGAVMLRLLGRGDVKLILSGYNDLEAAASRKMEDYQMLAPDYNTGFVASRFFGAKGFSFDVYVTPLWRIKYSFGIKQTWEDYRFNECGLLYPTRNAGEQAPTRMHTELRTRMDWNAGVSFLLTAGRQTDSDGERLASVGDNPLREFYLRGLAQYDAEPGDFGLHVFGQVGYASAGAPYSRLFDLSGTARAIYFFRNTFLTVRPNTFTSNLFAHLCLNYTASMPLWKTSWSQPQPFLQLGAMWGHFFGQDADGQLCQEDLLLQSPYMGLFEPATGFDGLLRWGLLDLGFGMAYQLCPLSAPYLNEDPLDNFAFGIVATLVFDKQKRNRIIPEPQYLVPEDRNKV